MGDREKTLSSLKVVINKGRTTRRVWGDLGKITVTGGRIREYTITLGDGVIPEGPITWGLKVRRQRDPATRPRGKAHWSCGSKKVDAKGLGGKKEFKKSASSGGRGRRLDRLPLGNSPCGTADPLERRGEGLSKRKYGIVEKNVEIQLGAEKKMSLQCPSAIGP